MTRTKYEATIWYDAAQKPDHTERQPTNVEKQRCETLEELREWIADQLWPVENIKDAGTELPDGRKEFGYWSKTKDRRTGKQWYQWATVEVRALDIEQLEFSEVLEG